MCPMAVYAKGVAEDERVVHLGPEWLVKHHPPTPPNFLRDKQLMWATNISGFIYLRVSLP